VDAADRDPKVAFVLSGGGNRGAMEVGVLLALLEQGIRPDMLVGTSVGAINAAAVAARPTLEGVRWLEGIWRDVTKKDVMPNNYLSMVWRLIKGETSLFTNDNLREFLWSHFPDGIRRFADIKGAELYITAVDLHTKLLHIFGIDRSESILDAIMASTALPVFLAPWQYRGRHYVDGGVISDLPMRVAVDRDATEIFAVDVGARRASRWSPRGILHHAGRIIDAISEQQVTEELQWATKSAHVDVHYIRLDSFETLRVWDFSKTSEMIAEGKRVGVDHLRQHGLA